MFSSIRLSLFEIVIIDLNPKHDNATGHRHQVGQKERPDDVGLMQQSLKHKTKSANSHHQKCFSSHPRTVSHHDRCVNLLVSITTNTMTRTINICPLADHTVLRHLKWCSIQYVCTARNNRIRVHFQVPRHINTGKRMYVTRLVPLPYKRYIAMIHPLSNPFSTQLIVTNLVISHNFFFIFIFVEKGAG